MEYKPSMAETITIRLRRRKSDLLKKSGGNLNCWLNDLIDHALDEPAPDWDGNFRRPRRKFPYTADEVRNADLFPNKIPKSLGAKFAG